MNVTNFFNIDEKLLERKGGRAHGVWVLLEPEYKGS